MRQTFTPIFAVLASVAILLTAHGLQLTATPLYANELEWSVSEIGYIGSMYFFGFMLGCFTIPTLVSWVGHIRIFAVVTSTATASLLLLTLDSHMEFWLLARLVTGWSLSGIYMVIESWLNERSTSETRGFILSVYTSLTLFAICIGQLLIGLDYPYVGFLVIAAILLAIGSVPVGLTRSPAPLPISRVKFELSSVFTSARVAVVGSMVSGLVTSGVWVLGPIVAVSYGLQSNQVGLFMSLTVLGGALLQVPVGRWSDRVDRRLVIAILSSAAFVLSLAACFMSNAPVWLIYTAMFLFGGLTFPLYSLSLAHANDNSTMPLIQTGSVVLLLHSGGAVVGPFFVSPLVERYDFGLFAFAAVVLAVFSAWSFYRLRTHPNPKAHFEPFTAVARTTQEAFDDHESDDVTYEVVIDDEEGE